MWLKRLFTYFAIFIPIIFMLLPLFMMVCGSFMGYGEIYESIGSIFGLSQDIASWPLLPRYPTLRAYIELLLDCPQFFAMFWNSCIQVLPSLFLQIIVATPAAWAFARFEFPGKKLLLFIYTILMILPFQVTMVSSYLVLDRFGFMNTHLALIIPNIFSTFPVFIMTKFFKGIPISLIEAAKLDGASEWNLFRLIGLPLGLSGVIAVLVLNFLEYWNNIEAPITFLRNKSLWPLSLYLPEIAADKMSVAFVASVIMLIPALLVFFLGQNYVEQGINASGMKE